MRKAKGKWNIIWIMGIAALLLIGCGGTWERSAGEAEEKQKQAEFFAYTDEENRLWFWEQDAGEAMLLTDKAFALEGEEDEGTGASYWEEWEYWQEWDDISSSWVWNYEKAMERSVEKAPDGSIYFAQEMRWKSFCMQRSAGEYEEALKYAEREQVEEYAGVRMFLYDLYRRNAGAEEENTGKVAENVCCYRMDGQGNVWYCKVEENGVKETGGAEYPFAACMLYRYDGKENLKIGEINGRREEPFRVASDGNYAVFFTLDDSLYGCEPDGETELLAEELHADLFDDWGVYTDADMNKIIYEKNDIVYIRDRKNGGEWQLADEGDILFIGMIGEKADRILTLRLEETAYADWIERGEEREDRDTKRLWELMERDGYSWYPSLCHARVTDISSGQAEDIQAEDGYLLTWSDSEELNAAREIYYMEMIPLDSFEKFTMGELLGEKTPADVLEYYEEMKEDEVYGKVYGEEYEKHILSEAFSYMTDRGALEKKADLYVVKADGISRAGSLDPENGILGSDYGEDGSRIYVTVYPRLDWEGENRNYRWLKDIYMLDGEGNCEKAVEAAEETAVKGNEVFYSRETGLAGTVSLYCSGFPGRIAEAVSISLESIQKSSCSDSILFLVNGLTEERAEEEIRAVSEGELKKAYRELTGGRTGYGEETAERTLILAGENGAEILEEEVFQYGFYGEDSVWMLQYEKEETGAYEEESGLYGGEDDWASWDSGQSGGKKGGSSLYIYENGEKRLITEQAVWMAGTGSRRAAEAIWVYE